MEKKTDIRTLTFEEIKSFFISNNEKSFRAKQVYEWLWKRSVVTFEEMTNLSISQRELLKEHFDIPHTSIETVQKSTDGTIKTAFKLDDNEIVEGVLIPTESRVTACISSQVGCALGCAFCATAKLNFKRNLGISEVYDQVVAIRKQASESYNLPLSNIVFMGMGEPLLNINNVLGGIDRITSEDGLGISPQRITVSTIGIPKMIKKLADEKVRFNLAVSLHTANDLKRSSMMPANNNFPLDELAESLIYFHQETGARITFEYLLLNNFNDTINDAKDLARFCRNFPCKINIIEYNPVEGSSFQKSTQEQQNNFVSFLESKNMVVNVRRSRGKDIDAACGQLACKKSKD